MDEETYCRQMLAEIEMAYRKAAEPYVRRLTAILMARSPVVTIPIVDVPASMLTKEAKNG